MENLGQQSQMELIKEKDKAYKCKICDQESKNNKDFENHFKIAHETMKQHKCDFCVVDFQCCKLKDTH